MLRNVFGQELMEPYREEHPCPCCREQEQAWAYERKRLEASRDLYIAEWLEASDKVRKGTATGLYALIMGLYLFSLSLLL